MSKRTCQNIDAPWEFPDSEEGNGEAGNFVEVSSRGGIVEYEPDSKIGEF